MRPIGAPVGRLHPGGTMARNELQPDPLYVEPFVDVDEWRDGTYEA